MLAVALVATSITFGAACSDSSPGADARPSTTTARAASTPSSTTAPTPSTTTTTLPPSPSTTSITNSKYFVTIRGNGSLLVPIPARVPLPAIVHAQHGGTSSFVVSGIDSLGDRTAVLASALGSYNGTFAVGFVESSTNPTTKLMIATRGPWQIDIGTADLAAPLAGGQQGVGDTVLSYRGPAVTAHLVYTSTSRLIVNVYGRNGGLIPLVDTKGPYDGPISLLPGPLFIAVTTAGKWSMVIEKP